MADTIYIFFSFLIHLERNKSHRWGLCVTADSFAYLTHTQTMWISVWLLTCAACETKSNPPSLPRPFSALLCCKMHKRAPKQPVNQSLCQSRQELICTLCSTYWPVTHVQLYYSTTSQCNEATNHRLLLFFAASVLLMLSRSCLHACTRCIRMFPQIISQHFQLQDVKKQTKKTQDNETQAGKQQGKKKDEITEEKERQEETRWLKKFLSTSALLGPAPAWGPWPCSTTEFHICQGTDQHLKRV